MVFSRINNSINYQELKNVDSKDINYETIVYKGKLFNKDINFVLGQPNFDHIESNIIFFYIYLVKDDKIYSKIGLYETNNNSYISLLDKDNDLIIEKLNQPLLFTFAKKTIKEYIDLKLQENITSDDDDSDDGDDDHDDDDSDDDNDSDDDTKDVDSKQDIDKEFDILDKPFIIKPIPEQTLEEANKEWESYIYSDERQWINNYLRSIKYDILDNEGGGDCFFAILRDGLSTINRDISVKDIRNKLSLEANEDIFTNYRDIYDNLYDEYNKLLKDKKDNKKEIALAKAKLESSHLLSQEKQNYINIANKAKDNYIKISKNLQELTSTLNEFKFMNGIDSLEKFRNIIKTSDFWADNWAVSTLERLYNVKFIILSKYHYHEGDYNNVIQCGETDKFLAEKNIFQPSYYILADYYIGVHYKLIKYMDRGALTFKEIPYKIKEFTVNKCLEKLGGSFSIIPDFLNFRDKLLSQKGIQIIDHEKTFKSEIKNISEKINPDKSKESELYNDDIVFTIHSRAADQNPGKGTGEKIDSKLLTLPNILQLRKIKDWRKMLDNSFERDNLIEINGEKFNSINKYISDKLKKTQDNSEIMEKLLYSKFSNSLNQDLKQILLLTENAKLMSYVPRKPVSPFIELMKVRNLIKLRNQ